MFTFNKSVAAIAVAASLGLSVPVYAGNNDGGLKGVVIDSQNNPLANASIVIRNVGTGLTKTIQADSQGRYRIGLLPIGTYSLTAEKDGFETVSLGDVRVVIGQDSVVNVPMVADGYEKIEVTGSAVSAVDVSTSESALNISSVELARLPVPRNVTSVALLAPGVTRGDNRFSDGKGNSFASFGGSSIAENSYYINGLNVTNFRNGVGFSEVPYEFYEQFQVKSGGYSAEFGRSTGGVINAVTKSGSNEFQATFNAYWQPEALAERSPNSYFRDGNYYIYNEADERSELKMDISVSGAIIQDTLFYYLIYSPRDVSQEYVDGEGKNFHERSQDDGFWGAKIDWNITDNHLLEFLAFSDENTRVTDNFHFNSAEKAVGQYQSTSYEDSGGKNWSVKYTGYLTDDLNVSVLYGENKYNLTSSSTVGAECPLVYDTRTLRPNGLVAGCATLEDYLIEDGNDKREAFRIDAEWALGDHLLRFGMDSEVNSSYSKQKYSGPDGIYWVLYDGSPGNTLPHGATIPDGVTQYARSRFRTISGDFETEASAFYLEDIWSVNDDVTLTLGLRNERFTNKNSEGEAFIEIDDMIAPRLGVAWDLSGNGESKLYANVGRYFLPIANNTNARLAGNELDQFNYYVLEGETYTDFNGIKSLVPTLGNKIGETQVSSNGEVADTRIIVDQDIDPMYQDEIIIGYEAQIGDEWAWGIKGIQRKLNGAIDDMRINHYLNEKYGCGHIGNNYVLGNPGKDMTVLLDTDCDGKGDKVDVITGEKLGYPVAKRTYNAIELGLRKMWGDGWSVDMSYTWAHSYGNSEGLVKSDNAQTDAGLTTDFDYPQLMDGAYGNLPNDRRHMFKAFGSYEVVENFLVGANFTLESGRPTNAFGIGHPDGVPGHGATYYICTAQCNTDDNADAKYAKVSRGTYGRTPWTARLDLSAVYNLPLDQFDMQFRLDIFNVLNAQNQTRMNESAEVSVPGNANSRFGLTSAYQTPRYVQIGFSAKY